MPFHTIQYIGYSYKADIVQLKTIENFKLTPLYSYYSYNGYIYSGDFERSGRALEQYGEPYESGDTIDIWLDLRKDKNTIAWDKNGTKVDKKINVTPNTEYRLAISTEYGEIELILFEILY